MLHSRTPAWKQLDLFGIVQNMFQKDHRYFFLNIVHSYYLLTVVTEVLLATKNFQTQTSVSQQQKFVLKVYSELGIVLVLCNELGLVNMLKVSFGLKWKLLPLKYLFSVYIFQVLSQIDVSQIYILQELIVTVETKLIFQVCLCTISGM